MKKFCLILVLLFSTLTLYASDKPMLAVMEFEDRSGSLPERTLSDAAEYLRSALASSGKFILIAKERQEKAMIAEMKKESYKSCNDKNCQIPLGQALSADTILRTTINFFGGTYIVTSELINLEKEATEKAVKAIFDNGNERELRHALNDIAQQITGVAVDTKKYYHPHLTSGISFLTIGAVITVAGIAGFHVASEKKFDEYKKMKTSDKASAAVAAGMNHAEYLEKANNYRDKAKTYRKWEIASGIIGGSLFVTGVILVAIQKEVPRNFALKDFSVSPFNDGFYASLGFEF